MQPNLEEKASRHKYATNVTSLPLNVIDMFKGMRTEVSDVSCIIDELILGNRELVLGSMASIYLSAGYFPEVNFNRKPLFNENFVFRVRPIHLARILAFFDNGMKKEDILASYNGHTKIKT